MPQAVVPEAPVPVRAPEKAPDLTPVLPLMRAQSRGRIDHLVKVALARLFSTIKSLFEKEYFSAKIIVEITMRTTVY